MTKQKKAILSFDIETAPSFGAYFQLYREGNIVWTVKDWYIMSWSAKFLEENKTIVRALPDYKNYKKNPEDDSALCAELRDLIEQAEVLVAHNGNKFDIKKVNTRFILNGIKPYSPKKAIDTKVEAKKYFGFDSNKLADLARQLGLGEKEDTGGIDLWKDCINGDLRAWAKMKKYNKQDVILLEKVYLYLRPWMRTHPNMNFLLGTLKNCPNCGSSKIHRRGTTTTRVSQYQRYHCQSCGSWHQGERIKLKGTVLR